MKYTIQGHFLFVSGKGLYQARAYNKNWPMRRVATKLLLLGGAQTIQTNN